MDNDKQKIISVAVCCFLGLFVIIGLRNQLQNKTYSKNSLDVLTSQANQSNHPLVFFDKDTFYTGIEQVKKENKSFSSRIVGGVIPHHLFPGFIIADFFNRISKQNPKTIILIGPNHYERGDSKALSSMYGWETPFGVVGPNEQIIKELTESNLIKINEDVLPKDHAVAGIMPFVKYYLPDSKVVPILLSGFMSEGDIRALSNDLKKYLNEDTIIISAVDFSHYLTSPQAQEKDKTTLELMQSFNYQKLLSLNNDFLDSPPSIVTLLMAMHTLGTTKMEVLYHTNSGELQKNNSIETTSYFSIVYY